MSSCCRKNSEKLGFSITDTEGFFGKTTIEAVRGFQNKHGIDPITSVVDEETARVINGAIDALGRDRYLVKGKVVHVDGRPVARTRSCTA